MSKCPYGSKGNYVKEEDCHCFCCGVHDGKKRDIYPGDNVDSW